MVFSERPPCMFVNPRPPRLRIIWKANAANRLWRIEPASLAFNESPSSTKIWGVQGQD